MAFAVRACVCVCVCVRDVDGDALCKSASRYSRELLVPVDLTFRHRASCILRQAFRYSPENAFYIFNQQIYFII